LTNKDGTGLYIELLHMVYDEVGIKAKYEIVPWTLAVTYIDSTLADAMLGSYNTVDAYFPKYPLDTEFIRLICNVREVKKAYRNL
jgi:hypothetical protein